MFPSMRSWLRAGGATSGCTAPVVCRPLSGSAGQHESKALGVWAALAFGCGGSDAAEFNEPLEAACGATEDEGIDGSVDVTWKITSDDRGFVVREEAYRGDSATAEEVWEYTWRNDGVLLEEVQTLGGVETQRTTFVWDGPNLVERSRFQMGQRVELLVQTYAGTDPIDEPWDWDFDGDHESRGLLLSKSIDWASDADFDLIEDYQHEDGRIVEGLIDIDADIFRGEDFVETWIYQDGALSRLEAQRIRGIQDEAIDYYSDFEIDNHGLWQSLYYWSDNSGTTNHVTETHWQATRNSSGYILEQTFDFQNLSTMDSAIHRSWSMTYDGNRMTRYEVRTEDEVTAYEYQFDCPAARRLPAGHAAISAGQSPARARAPQPQSPWSRSPR